MLSLHLLPAALAAYLLASPVFAAAAATPTSSNDPFRAIAAQVARRKPDLPVCCLKPIQPLEPLEDEVLLSFEEWKQKQTVLQEKERAKEREANNRSTHTGGRSSGDNGNASDTTVLSHNIRGTGDAADVGDELTKTPKTEPLPPHFRVPLVDRFNYASVECSARVHLSHRSAKSASSILSSKRDRYMLSPCNPPNKERQFVVVELCEDIRIDTVQLANFEFFSGIFKEFRISVAKTDITGEEEFTDAGVFRAKNVRGVQSFHPPTSLRDFYRYIRIDFLSHYGNEYYCPLSLLRVYGLTHLEQWKWDTWEQESRAKMDTASKTASKDEAHNPSIPVDAVGNPPALAHEPDAVDEATTAGKPLGNVSSTAADNNIADDSRVTATDDSAQSSIFSTSGSHFSTTTVHPSIEQTGAAKTPNTKPTVTTSPVNDSHDTSHISSSPSPISALAPDVSIATQRQQPTDSSNPPLSEPTTVSSSNGAHSSSSTAKSASNATAAVKAVTTNITTSVVPTASQHSIMPPTTGGGESIYRTIMNRLTALEANHTLYARYVEQQTGGVRELLRRLGEDVGRLEGIGKAQSQTYQRQLRDWEKRQMQMQMDFGELMARVEYLSDEIVLEKRLGIAQLCLLLAVLVFMGLTRGSRGDDQRLRINRSSMREWSKRHLRFSGDWTGRFRRRRSDNGEDLEREQEMLKPYVQPSRPVSFVAEGGNVKFEFPTTERRVHMQDDEKIPLRSKNMNTHNHTHETRVSARSKSSDASVQPWRKPRSRTPSLRNAAVRARPPGTPTSSSTHRPRLQRSNSHSGPGNHNVAGGLTHRSARKWARTAHLHEVRTVDRGVGLSGGALRNRGLRGSDGERYQDGDRENVAMGVFGRPRTGTEFWTCQDGNGEEARVVRVDELGSPRRERRKGKEPRIRPVKFEPPDVGESDPWVDTELEESEAEWDFKLDTGRSMSFAAAGNEH